MTPETPPTTTEKIVTTPATPTDPPVYPSSDSTFPQQVHFNVTIKDKPLVTCLDVKLAAQFVLVNESKYLSLVHPSQIGDSFCETENDTQISLDLTFGGNNVTFTFKRTEDSSSAWLDTIHLRYFTSNGESLRVRSLYDR